MRKHIFTECVAVCVLVLFSVSTYAADIPYSVSPDNENKNIVVSGILQDAVNEEVTLVVLDADKELSVLDSGMSARNDILYIRQVKTNDDGEYSFKLDYTSEDIGQHKARLVANNGADKTDFYIPIVDPDAYKTAAAAVNTAAKDSSLTNEQFTAVVNDNMDALVLGYELNNIVDIAAAMNNFRTHITSNSLAEDSAKEADNTKVFRTFVIAQGIKDGNVTDIAPYISDMMIDAEVIADYKTLAADNTDSSIYITNKMKNLSLGTATEINTSAKTALLFGMVKYADGFGDVQTALENYGYLADITGSINRNACGKMAGKDYSSTKSIYNDYTKYSNSTSGSSGNSGGGAGGTSTGKSTSPDGFEVPVIQSAKPATVNIFKDIEGVDWAHEAITALYNKGIVDGTGENRFEPDNPVTREQFVKIIIGAMDMQDEKAEVCGFADVDTLQWYAKYVNIACVKGICQGVGDNKFGTGEQITRQDMAVMLFNAMKSTGKTLTAVDLPFEDSAEITDYALRAVGALYGMGAVNGVSATEFAPKDIATRAQAAKMVYEVLDMLQ